MNAYLRILTTGCLLLGGLIVPADDAGGQIIRWRTYSGPRVIPNRRVLPPSHEPAEPEVVYVVPTPNVDANPLPPAAEIAPEAIVTCRISNPLENGVTLKYAIITSFVDAEGITQQQIKRFSLAPGEHQDLKGDRRRTISYDRGGRYGRQRYSLTSGLYTFRRGDRGWTLQRSKLETDENPL